jgi:hypothetical protein
MGWQQADAWRDGKLVILAAIAEGKDAGGSAMCITSRQDFKSIRRDATPHRLDCHKLSTAIRSALILGVSGQAEQDLIDDLAILMALRVNGYVSEEYLAECGLFAIGLSVNPDTSLPWHKRGFLDAKGSKETPFTITL